MALRNSTPLLAVAVICLAAFAQAAAVAEPRASLLDAIERRIDKQPEYKSTPRYALLVFGTDASVKVWIVEDGRTLYVDKNANNDLTDDGPPLYPSEVKEFKSDKGPSFQFVYSLDAISPVRGPSQTNLRVRRWNYGEPEDSYGISVTVDGKVPMYAGWFGTFWAASPNEVPIIHFGGPLKLKQIMRFNELPIGAKGKRLSVGFINSGRGDGATTRLDIFALPPADKFTVEIDWPVAAGSPSVRTSTDLTERCCYWEFYNSSFDAPDGIVPGMARATLSLTDTSFPFDLETNQFEFPVVARRSIVEPE